MKYANYFAFFFLIKIKESEIVNTAMIRVMQVIRSGLIPSGFKREVFTKP